MNMSTKNLQTKENLEPIEGRGIKPKVYLGIYGANGRSKGNLGTVWTEGPDGLFRSPQSPGRPLTREEILSDERNGFIKRTN